MVLGGILGPWKIPMPPGCSKPSSSTSLTGTWPRALMSDSDQKRLASLTDGDIDTALAILRGKIKRGRADAIALVMTLDDE